VDEQNLLTTQCFWHRLTTDECARDRAAKLALKELASASEAVYRFKSSSSADMLHTQLSESLTNRKNGFSRILDAGYGCTAPTPAETAFSAFEQYLRISSKNIYTQYDNFVSIFIENSC